MIEKIGKIALNVAGWAFAIAVVFLDYFWRGFKFAALVIALISMWTVGLYVVYLAGSGGGIIFGIIAGVLCLAVVIGFMEFITEAWWRY